MCVCLQVCILVMCVLFARAKLRLAEEGKDNGVGPSCAAMGGNHPVKTSLTMDISGCSGCLLCPLQCSGISSSSHTDSPHTMQAGE